MTSSIGLRRNDSLALVLGAMLFLLSGGAMAHDRPLTKKQKLERARIEQELRHERIVAELIKGVSERDAVGDRDGREKLITDAASELGNEHATIRVLRGEVEVDGKWLTPEEVAQRASSGDLKKQYATMRAGTADDQAGHMALAQWAKSNRLTNESRAHYLRVLDFDPENSQIRRELEHLNVDGRWLTRDQVDEIAAENNRRSELAKQFAQPVTNAASRMLAKNKSTRIHGEKLLNDITDPQSTYAIENIVYSQPPQVATLGLKRVSHFEGRDATGSLLRAAVYHNDSTCRQTATESLKGRETTEFIPELVSMLESPVSSQFSLTPVGFGQLHHQHVFTQKRFDQDVVRQYDQFFVAEVDLDTAPAQTQQINLAVGQEGLRRMEAAMQNHNQNLQERNSRVMNVLREITNESPGDDASDWWQWWYDRNETNVAERPVSYRRETLGNVVTPSVRTGGLAGRSGECFVAGTPVWTEHGLVAIEKIKTGDRVLSKDLKSGQLVYRIVIRPTTREPAATFEIRLGNETLRVSGGHPFQVYEKGWVRARHLQPGIPLVTRSGTVLVESIKETTPEQLYNLVVERDSNYFVGENSVLSHDHTVPKTPVVKPTAATR